MEVQFFGLCDLASVTREGKVNLMGIFRQIFVQNLPTNYLKFTLVAMVKGDENSQQQVVVRIQSPDDQKLMEQAMTVGIGTGGNANIFFEVVHLPLSQTGDYMVRLEDKQGKELAMTIFKVLRVSSQPSSGVIN